MDRGLFVVGLVVSSLAAADVLFTLVLPRRPSGIERLTLGVNRAVRGGFVLVSRLATSYEGKDAILASVAPVALAGQLVVWAGALIVGLALVLMPTVHSFPAGLMQATTSLFTVGQAVAGGPFNHTVDIVGGALWVVIVALQIAYLPSLYAAVNRRETLVSLLESRAGTPAWGPELLARHQLVGITDTLPELYAAWEEWAADVAESHTTYPILLLFRSPEPWFSWLLALLAVLDGAALHLALAPEAAASQARLCLRMGFTLLNRVATTLGWEVDPDPRPEGPIQLTFEEFERAVAMLNELAFPIERPASQAWADFRGWRVNYEQLAYRLADWTVAPPVPWSGPRRHVRAGTVEPRRPPQRRPGGGETTGFERPPAALPERRRRTAPPGGR